MTIAGFSHIYLLDGYLIEYFGPILTHSEGQVFGVGCKIFTIAGPVILYGILSSWTLGVVYWMGDDGDL